jgi:hypothetical protein
MARIAKVSVIIWLLVLCGPAWAVEPNLVSHWKFDDGSGAIAYDSAGTNDGTVNGAVWTTGQVDGALDFDGMDDYVRVNNPDNLNFGNSIDFTFAAWIKAGTVQRKHPAIIGRRNLGNAHGYIFFLHSYEKLAVQLNDGIHSNYISTGPGLCDDTWHHVAATGDRDGYLIFYIDGVQAGQIDISGKGNIDSTANLYIGWEERHSTVTYFNGIIDDVRIYNRALSEEEIKQLYQAAPVACIVGGDRTVEAGSSCKARVTLDGSCSSDADSTPGTNDDINDFDWYLVDACDPNFKDLLGSGEIIDCNLPLGEHDIVLEVTDKAGAFDVNEVTIIVEDTTPPEFSLAVEPDVLWPANHRMVKITPSWEVSDNCDEWPEVSLVSITVATEDDIQIGDEGIWLRAERSERGIGRVYTISYQAVDDSGNVTVNSTTVTVPHDRRRR